MSSSVAIWLFVPPIFFFFRNGDPTPLEAVSLGLAARSLSGICLLPFTVVKTRFEVRGVKYQSFHKIIKKEAKGTEMICS